MMMMMAKSAAAAAVKAHISCHDAEKVAQGSINVYQASFLCRGMIVLH